MTDILQTERAGRVLVLTLNRPAVLNALNSELVRSLRAAIDGAARDQGVGAIVLTGSGRAFSTGADLHELSTRTAAEPQDLGEDLRRVYVPLIRSMRSCLKPIIAAINGVAAGAGLSLALASDLRLASSDAQLIVLFVRVGLVPDAGALFFLTRLVGWSKAAELALTGDPVAADEAQRLGLVSQVLRSGDALRDAAMERASRFAAGPAQTQGLIKRGLERVLTMDLEQALELEAQLQSVAGRSAEHRDAVRAFLERRQSRVSSPSN